MKFKITLRPYMPWNPILGWFSFLFFHFKKTVPALPPVATETITDTVQNATSTNETKRRTYQPGTVVKTTYHAVLQPHIATRVKDLTKSHSIQPRGDLAALAALDDHEGKSFQHKFFGSQLIIGDRPIITGLSHGIHLLEITGNDRLFIDHSPFQINPTELIKMKSELAKAQ